MADKLKNVTEYEQAFPKDINRFNWGAFLMPCVWGPANNTLIPLLSLVIMFAPFGFVLNIVFSIYCGIKGNEWAWTNKQWNSIKEFHSVQKKWAIRIIIAYALIFAGMTYAISYSIQYNDNSIPLKTLIRFVVSILIANPKYFYQSL